MTWIEAEFDGEKLTFASLTRRHTKMRVAMLVAEPLDDVYPTAARVQGAGKMLRRVIQRALERRYGTAAWTQVEGDDLLVVAEMPRIRLGSNTLQAITPFEDAFGHPRITIQGGMIRMLLEGKADQPDAAFQDAVDATDEAHFSFVPTPDLTPWDGLESLAGELRDVMLKRA